MAEYKSTTDKHPTDNLLVAKRSGKIQLGKGKILDVDAGDHARASDTYEGQAGPSKLFAPTGNHSKFALSPQTVNKFFKPADSGEKLNVALRDERGTKPNVQTGGRRSPEEIASAGKPRSKKSKPDDRQDRMKIGNQSQNEPMRLAAGDQYDTQDVDNLIEQLCALDDNQLDEFLDTLSDEQVETIEQLIGESKLTRAIESGEKKGEDTTELQNKLDRKNVVRRWQQGLLGDRKTDVNAQQRMAAKGGRSFGATQTLSRLKTTPVPQQTGDQDRGEKLAAYKTLSQHARGKTPDTGAAEQQVRAAQEKHPELAQHFATKISKKLQDQNAQPSHKAGRPGRTYELAYASQPAQGSARGPGEEQDPVRSGVERGARGDVADAKSGQNPQTQSGPGLRSRAGIATARVRLPRTLAKRARTIGASVEHDTNLDQIQENEETQMNNYVETAINGDAINFTNAIRDALDAHAHAAIEQIKTSMLESDDVQQQDDTIDEQVESMLEQLDQLDEQQLDQYLGELNEQELLQIEQLLDEAKYGTKKGRHRLAMKIRAGKDIGKKGKHFEEIAKKAGKRYGSAERGRAVAAAAMWKRLGGKKGK